jgi:FtsH-binding integral membrane protein
VNPYESARLPYAGSATGVAERVTSFLRVVYGWMFAGLAVTAIVAWLVTGTPALVMAIASNRIAFWGLALVQLGMVFYLSARVDKLAPGTAALLFLLYSGLTGVTMAFVLLVYTGESVALTFFVAAGMFGAVALYGTVTTRSLAGVGQFMFMGLIGIVLASIVGIFWQNDTLQFMIAFIGVAAWDAQRLKAMALSLPDGRVGSYAVVGALSLYLDFINLFLSLLRLMGSRRD